MTSIGRQKRMRMSNVIVVGGGAAGMMAAIAAAKCGHNVTLLEKMKSLGKSCLLREKAVVM